MKNISVFILMFLVLCTNKVWTQTNLFGSIKGSVLNESQEAIPFATISLFSIQNKLIQGGISDDNGNFTLDGLPLDSLVLEIQYLGYQQYRQVLVLNKKNKKVNLGNIQMQLNQTQLDEVVVTAEKSKVNLRLDKKVFNVGADLIAQGGSAIDILGQVPLVSVDPSGAVLLRGNSAVQILINGKRSGLTFGNALDQISGDNIERIEVITNPSASFDAAGAAGIINIILKKNKQKGLSGQLRAEVGTPANYVLLPGLNYKNQRVNLFANLRFRFSDYIGRYKTDQRTFDDNGETSSLKLFEDENRHDDGRSGYFGSDFYINKHNTITAAFFRAETKDTDETVLNYTLGMPNQDDRKLIRTGNSIENRNYNQLEANYTRTYDVKGQRFSIDFQYDFWNSEKDWDLLTTGDLSDTEVTPQLRTNNKAGSRDYMLRSDFVKPFGETQKIEFGAKIEHRVVKNDYIAEAFQDEQWRVFQGIDNNVNYGESIGAAYLQYQNSWKGFDFMVGLRSELTQINIEDDESVFSDENTYINLFPSAFVSRKLNDKNEMQLSYSRRINRPSLWNLYPFFEITDFNFQQTGNPNLNPAFTDAFEINLLSSHDKITINPGIYYRHSQQPISWYLFENENDVFITKPVNIDHEKAIGAEVSIRYQPLKVLGFNAELNWNRFDLKGDVEGQNLDASGNNWHLRLISNLNVFKGYRLRTMFDYWGPEKTAQIEFLDTYLLSFALSKSFMNEKLSFSIQAYNVLDSRAQRSIASSDSFYIEQDGRRNRERFSLQMVYRFNQNPRDRMRQARRGNR